MHVATIGHPHLTLCSACLVGIGRGNLQVGSICRLGQFAGWGNLQESQTGIVALQDVKSSKATFINRTQQCFAVKSGVDGILDLARSTFCRVTEQVHELVDKYKTDCGIDTLKVPPSIGST